MCQLQWIKLVGRGGGGGVMKVGRLQDCIVVEQLEDVVDVINLLII